MRERYFGEEGYSAFMQNTVEPYIRKYGERSCFCSYDGRIISYYAYRKPQAKGCIVISHGFCEFGEKYNEVIYYFLQAGYSVYLPEHRGHGYSEQLTPDRSKVHIEDFEDYVRDFRCFLTEIVGQQKKFLFAHSMGGAIAVRYLEEYPESFEGAVLSAPMLRIKTGKCPGLLAEWAADWFVFTGRETRYAAGQRGFDFKADFAGSGCLSEERYRYVFDKRLANFNYRTYGATYGWLRAVLQAEKNIKRKNNLQRIKTPILLLLAGREHMVDNRAALEFVNRVNGVSVVCLEEAKHEIYNADYETRVSYYGQIFHFFDEITEKEDCSRPCRRETAFLPYRKLRRRRILSEVAEQL